MVLETMQVWFSSLEKPKMGWRKMETNQTEFTLGYAKKQLLLDMSLVKYASLNILPCFGP